MHDRDKFDRKIIRGNYLPGFHNFEFAAGQQVMFLQAAADHRNRQPGTINRNLELGQNKGQSPDMIFMPMGQDNTFDSLFHC